MNIDEDEYPYLMTEHTWSWGPVAVVFEQKSPPDELVSNIAMAPFDDSGWLIVRQKVGWGIVGGTLEPGETYIETLRRELLEEAGCELIDCEIFGALRMRSLAPIPYRAHLPHPVSYRLLGVGKVRRVGEPTNPDGGEHILEVSTYPLDEVCRKLHTRLEDGPLLAEIYRLAAAFRRHRSVSSDITD
jgi:8-oxo-dGTP pyrophosphatase MutT (NUDIX family)